MSSKKLTGLYPGTFDPVTLGHLDIIKRAVKLVDHLVIGVATNISKEPMFTLDERVAMVRSEAEKLAAMLVSVVLSWLMPETVLSCAICDVTCALSIGFNGS